MIRYRVISPYIKDSDSGFVLLTKNSASRAVNKILSDNKVNHDIKENPEGVWSDQTTNSIHAQLIPMVFSDKYNLITDTGDILVAFANAQSVLGMFPEDIYAKTIENGFEIQYTDTVYKMLETKKTGNELIDIILRKNNVEEDNWVLNGYAITQDRQRDYGHPLANFIRIALRDNIRDANKLAKGKYYTPLDVALRNIDQKMAREQNPHAPVYSDNYIDIVGYTNTIALMNTEMKRLGYNGVDDFASMNIQDMFELLILIEEEQS